MWNDGKSHVLEFGSIRHTAGFDGAKLLKIGSTNFEGLLKSHSGPEQNTLPGPSLDLVLIGLFDDQQGRWKECESSLGTKPIGGVVTVIPIPETSPLIPSQDRFIFSCTKHRAHVS